MLFYPAYIMARRPMVRLGSAAVAAITSSVACHGMPLRRSCHRHTRRSYVCHPLEFDVGDWPIAAALTGYCRGSFWGQSGHGANRSSRQLMTQSGHFRDGKLMGDSDAAESLL